MSFLFGVVGLGILKGAWTLWSLVWPWALMTAAL